VRPSPVLCTRSPTPATVLIAARHAAPITCTPRGEQTQFSNRNKDKRKEKQNYPGFKLKPRQVNDSSQSNQGTDHLVSQLLYNITLTPVLRDKIIVAQKNDEGMSHIKRRIEEGDPKVACFYEDMEGTLWFEDRLVMPKKEVLKKKILDKAHTLRHSIHPGSIVMYHDLRQQFWWTRMKRETSRYV
jgi:hypothetical protein